MSTVCEGRVNGSHCYSHVMKNMCNVLSARSPSRAMQSKNNIGHSLKMEAVCSFQMSGTTNPTAQCHVPEDLTRQVILCFQGAEFFCVTNWCDVLGSCGITM
jgi:hypothetical protein